MYIFILYNNKVYHHVIEIINAIVVVDYIYQSNYNPGTEYIRTNYTDPLWIIVSPLFRPAKPREYHGIKIANLKLHHIQLFS